MTIDWRRVVLSEHMTEAAAVVGECHVVLDFGEGFRARYEVKVWGSLKGGGDDPYFALATDPDDPAGFRPFGSATTPEEALQACLNAAGVHLRRRVKQADG
jgi:hypothetical protein